MPRIISDEEIKRLLEEQKPLPPGWKARLTPRAHVNQRSHSASVEITGDDGHLFRVTVRQNPHSLLDFSIILGVKEGNEFYHLIRCNGKHPSEHTNRWEKNRGEPTQTIRNQFHVHLATERYQLDNLQIEGFAETTSEYGSLDSAVAYMLDAYGFVMPDDKEQQSLFK